MNAHSTIHLNFAREVEGSQLSRCGELATCLFNRRKALLEILAALLETRGNHEGTIQQYHLRLVVARKPQRRSSRQNVIATGCPVRPHWQLCSDFVDAAALVG